MEWKQDSGRKKTSVGFFHAFPKGRNRRPEWCKEIWPDWCWTWSGGIRFWDTLVGHEKQSFGVQWALILPNFFPTRQLSANALSPSSLCLDFGISLFVCSLCFSLTHLIYTEVTDYHRSEPEVYHSLKTLWWFLLCWWLQAPGKMEAQHCPGSGDCSQQNLYLAIISSHIGLGQWFLLPKGTLGLPGLQNWSLLYLSSPAFFLWRSQKVSGASMFTFYPLCPSSTCLSPWASSGLRESLHSASSCLSGGLSMFSLRLQSLRFGICPWWVFTLQWYKWSLHSEIGVFISSTWLVGFFFIVTIL